MDVIARSIGGCGAVGRLPTAKEYDWLLLNAQVVVSVFGAGGGGFGGISGDHLRVHPLRHRGEGGGGDRRRRMYTIGVTGMDYGGRSGDGDDARPR